MIQYNTIQYNTIQYNTIQYNTIQYNTILYNTIQYSLKHMIHAWKARRLHINNLKFLLIICKNFYIYCKIEVNVQNQNVGKPDHDKLYILKRL